MQISAIETYRKYRNKADVLRNRNTMALLAGLAENSPMEVAELQADFHDALVLLKETDFVVVDHDKIKLTAEGRNFLELLGFDFAPRKHGVFEFFRRVRVTPAMPKYAIPLTARYLLASAFTAILALSIYFFSQQLVKQNDASERVDGMEKENPTPTSSSASLKLDAEDARQAFSLDSADEKLLQEWNASRTAPSGADRGSWVKAHYWPLQSIGLRLAELAQLEPNQNQTASTQIASVPAIAEDLAQFCLDALLRNHLQYMQELDRDKNKKKMRTDMILSYLRGRIQTQERDHASALKTLQQTHQDALLLGDSLTASEIGLALLDIHVAKEEYAAVVLEGEKCVALAERIHYLWVQAQALNRIADAARILGRDQSAMTGVNKALQIAQLQHDWRTQRDNQLYRARILYETEKYRDAEIALQEVAALDAEQTYQGDILLLQGQMHLDRGEYGLAQAYLERAVAEFERNQNTANVAAAYSTLSLLHMEQGDDQNALDTEGKALAIYEREKSARRICWSQLNLGFIYAKFDNPAQAEAALAQAIACMQEKGEPRVLAQALVLQGNLQLRQKSFTIATLSFAEALTRSQQVGFQYGQASALIGQARLALAESKAMEAESNLISAEKIARELREPHLLTEALFRRGLLCKQTQNAPAALDFLEQAITWLEQRFHSIARDSSRMQFFAPAQEIFDEAILLALTLGQDERALQFSERARARALLESVGAAARDRNIAAAAAIPTPGQIRQILPDQSSVIVYRMTADTLVSWAISKNTFRCRKLPLPQESLANAVQQFRASIGAVGIADFRNRVAQNAAAVYQENRRLGRELFRMLLEPWLDELREGGTIYLVPDGVLHQIPFGALVTTRDNFLEQENVLLRVPSLAMFHQGWRSPRTIPAIANQRLLIVSNPAGDFPAAGEEKNRLAELFAEHSVLQREQASFAALQEAMRGGAEILHLSVHALADPVRPLNSYLELSAPATGSASPRTERVFARQLLEMDLSSAWLTVLNGCETASGRIVHGEGALSLVRLFALQRVAVVVATLWKNDDWQSLPLVAGFYRELKGGADPAQALHRAKVEAIAELSRPSGNALPLPYFWAVFELYLNQHVVHTTT